MEGMRRVAAGVAALVFAGAVFAACGSDDNGGVIQGPTATTLAPGSTPSTAASSGGGTPGY